MSNYAWSFSTVGGVKRVNIEKADDLKNLKNLDPKLWAALSCPVNGLEFDHKTLQYIDSDSDQYIRIPEIIQAVDYLIGMLNDPEILFKKQDKLDLSNINSSKQEGEILFKSAKRILKLLGKANQEHISIEETNQIHSILKTSKFNGDGVITSLSTDEADLKQLIADIIDCLDGKPDVGGDIGIDVALVNEFYSEIAQFTAYKDEIIKNSEAYLVLKDKTDEGLQTFLAVKSKIEDYFLRCKISAFDESSTEHLNFLNKEIQTLAFKNLPDESQKLAEFPLSKVSPVIELNLQGGINPAWVDAIQLFNIKVVQVIFPGKTVLCENDLIAIQSKFEAYHQYLLQPKGNKVAKLGYERTSEILLQNRKDDLIKLIEKDLSLADEVANMVKVDQLVRYYTFIPKLLLNFVTFYDFYSGSNESVFQAGRLYIDQRSLDLCIQVDDAGKHASVAGAGGIFIIYCECHCIKFPKKIQIAAALTNGDIDNITVGKNALFVDRNGVDWHATVIKIIENPISIRQAFFTPYRKISQFIENQIANFASEQENKSLESAKGGISGITAKPEEGAATPKVPFDIGKYVGIFAAIGLAVGAIGTAVAGIISGFLGLKWWQMPLAVLGIILVISGPSMILAYLKLRKRNLAPLLDANGWAINANALINIPFGNTLTSLAQLPLGAKINLNDPFKVKKKLKPAHWLFIFFLAGAVLITLYFFAKHKGWI
jgi:hypothetical protein